MIRLVYSNRFEGLAGAFCDAMQQQRAADPLGFVDVVTANPVHYDALRAHVAHARRGWGAVRAHRLRAFLDESVERATGLRMLDASGWTRRVAAVLASDVMGASEVAPGLQPIVDWLGDDPSGARAVDLASRLGRLFDEYALSRLDLVGAWANGGAWVPARGTRVEDLEAWQRALWTLALERGPADERPLFEGILALPESTQDVTAPSDGTPRDPIHLFAVSAGGSRPAIEALRRIGMHRDVHVYTLNPCLEFWEDVDTRHRLGPDGLAHASEWARREGDQRPLDLDLDDPFGLAEPGDAPLLRLMGRPGREIVRLMGALTDCDFEPRFVSVEDPDATLLARVQTDVLERHPERLHVAPGEGRTSDASIGFVPAPDARAELDAVALQLRDALHSDAGELAPWDCAVLVPDGARERYLPLAAEALAAAGLPSTVLGERLVDTSPIARLTRDVLRWIGSRMERSILRRILQSEVLTDGGPVLADIAARRLDDLHVTVGDAPAGGHVADGHAVDGRQIERALTRAGWTAFVDPVDGAARPFDAGWPTARGPVAHLPASADAPEATARFVRVVRALVHDRDELLAGEATMAVHAERLARCIERHVRADGGADLEQRVRCVRAIRDVAAAFVAEGRTASGDAGVDGDAALTVPLDAVLERFVGAVEDLDHRSGGRIDGGVIVGPMEALRGLPFEIVHVVGLDLGVVPRPTGGDPLDVRTVRRVAGDVTSSDRERYRFLEAIVAARRRFVASWVDRDPSSGEPRPPSPLVDELRWVLRGLVDADALDAVHTAAPATPWDPAAIAARRHGDAGRAPLVRPARLHAAVIAASTGLDAAHLPSGVVEVRETAARPTELPTGVDPGAGGDLEVRLADLVRFVRSPLQATARYALGLRSDELDADDDVVPLAVDRWTARRLDDAIRHARIEGCSVDAAVARAWAGLALRGAVPAGALGEAARLRVESQTRAVEDALRGVGVAGLAALRSTHIGRPDRPDEPGPVVPSPVLDVVRRDGASARVRLVGTAPTASGETLVLPRARRRGRAEGSIHALRDLPRLVVGAAALIAAGRPVRRVLSVPVPLEDGDADAVAYTIDFDAENARRWLARLAGHLVSGLEPERLPVEVALGRAGGADPKHAGEPAEDLAASFGRDGRLPGEWGPIEDVTSFALGSDDRFDHWASTMLDLLVATARTRGAA